MKATRRELIAVLERIQDDVTNSDVLFDYSPHHEGEQARYEAAGKALAAVNDILTREK